LSDFFLFLWRSWNVLLHSELFEWRESR
jgi:hypothetical protein